MFLKEAPWLSPQDDALRWTPVDQEADPGILKPGKGAKRLWPIKGDFLIHRMSIERASFTEEKAGFHT